MKTLNWEEVKSFELDEKGANYPFSIRLAKEQNWTLNFTQQAILEYKKFMFLVARSQTMLAPSPIVDIVWHLHLIYSNSYTDFCTLLGKPIAHRPNSHRRDDSIDFSAAISSTRVAYTAYFGALPESFWDPKLRQDHILTSSKWRPSQLLLFLLVMCGVIWVPLAPLLRPVYVKLNNPLFLQLFYLLFFSGALFIMFVLIRRIGPKVKRELANTSFSELIPVELLVIQSGAFIHVIKGITHQLLTNGAVIIRGEKLVFNAWKTHSLEEEVALSVIKKRTDLSFSEFVSELLHEPCFNRLIELRKSIHKQWTSSKIYMQFLVGFSSVFLGIFTVGLVRILTGLGYGTDQDKPVGYLVISLVVLAVSFLLGLNWCSNYVFRLLFKLNRVKRATSFEDEFRTPVMNYALNGDSALPAVLLVLTAQSGGADGVSNSGCGASGCGGGCGGCGGCGS